MLPKCNTQVTRKAILTCKKRIKLLRNVYKQIQQDTGHRLFWSDTFWIFITLTPVCGYTPIAIGG